MYYCVFIFEEKKSSVKCEANIYQNNLVPVTLMVHCNFRKIKVDIEMDEGYCNIVLIVRLTHILFTFYKN